MNNFSGAMGIVALYFLLVFDAVVFVVLFALILNKH